MIFVISHSDLIGQKIFKNFLLLPLYLKLVIASSLGRSNL